MSEHERCREIATKSAEALIVAPRTAGLGMAFAMLVGNILSVAILEWAVMPLLKRARPWLGANGRDGQLVSVVSAVLIVAAALAMAVLFRVVSG